MSARAAAIGQGFKLSRWRELAGSRLARRLAGSFGVAVLSRLAFMVMAVVLARSLGPAEYGLFTFAIGGAVVASRFAALGWPSLAARRIPAYVGEEDWGRLRGLLRASDLFVLASSLLLAAAVASVATWGGLRDDLGRGLALSALLICPLALSSLRRQQLAAFGRPAAGLACDELLAPLALALAAVVWAVSVDLSVACFAAASALGVVLATVLIRRSVTPSVRAAVPAYAMRGWLRFAVLAMMGVSAKLLMNKTDVLMLAPLSTLDQVGYYGAAFRLTYALTFPQVVLSTVLSPMLSAAHAAGDTARLRRRFLAALAFSILTAGPLALGLMLFPDEVMALLFGKDFAPGGDVLAMLAFGQFIAAVSIPFAALALMADRERAYGIMTVMALAVNVLLNFILIPQYGAFGAAVAGTCASVALLIANTFVVKGIVARPMTSKESPLVVASAKRAEGT